MEQRIRVKFVGRDAHTVYVTLPGNRQEPGAAEKTVDLAELILGYQGPRVLLDFDGGEKLVGIEILT
jgi:Protein of unknown function (DUF2283)